MIDLKPLKVKLPVNICSIFIGGLISLFAVLFVPMQAVMAEYPGTLEEAFCGNPEEAGAVFYKFDKIIIYYTYFTHPDDEKIAEYPDDLKYENFNRLLVEAVKKNFAPCLKKADETEKEVMVIPPQMRQGGGYQERQKFQPLMQEMYDSKNLTIAISVSYMSSVPSRSPEDDLGRAMFNFYRPGLTPRQAVLTLKNNRGMAVFFPKRGDEELRQWLDGFFRQIRPIRYDVPPLYRSEVEWFKKFEENIKKSNPEQKNK